MTAPLLRAHRSSLLTSESFWWLLRDVRVDEERRKKPLHRWIGPVPCMCVRQAVAVFSLQNTPSPAAWPDYIGHLELALQRVLCADTRKTVGALWREAPLVRWSYVPVVAWLKSYPAHSPQLLPEGVVHEDDYIHPKEQHLMRLPSRRAPALELLMPPVEPSKLVLGLGKPRLLPIMRCRKGCHNAGWCGVWRGASGQMPRQDRDVPQCHCLSAMNDDAERVRRDARHFEPRDRGECAPPRAPEWKPGHERARRIRENADIAQADAVADYLGVDRWRSAQPVRPRAKACPNECLGRGTCAYGFCHCQHSYWGLDCGWSLERARQLTRQIRQPRIYVYEASILATYRLLLVSPQYYDHVHMTKIPPLAFARCPRRCVARAARGRCRRTWATDCCYRRTSSHCQNVLTSSGSMDVPTARIFLPADGLILTRSQCPSLDCTSVGFRGF